MVDCQFGGESTAQDAIDIAGSLLGAVLSAACLLTACGGSDDPPQDQPVTITVAGPNAVSTWNEIASATSTTRTADQSQLALFGTSTPPLYWEVNMRTFATTNRSLADHARLMAMVWVAQNDSGNTCFESKYFYERWRPTSAITLADTDGNAGTYIDAAWVPVMPTPNHPEYPAAHSCISGAMAGILSAYYGTPNITFDFVGAGPATGITRHYTSMPAMLQEIQTARIAGGMHFRTSTVEGEAGRNVA